MHDKLRIAIRRFDPFEAAIRKQYAAFQEATGCPLELEAVQLELNPLTESLFANDGLRNGDWDIAFLVTDWIADCVEKGLILDLAPFHQRTPVPDYPSAWASVLTQMQTFGKAIYGFPYHDGPECFVYRKDWFDDPVEHQEFRSRFGQPLKVPNTWDEFERIARFFTRPKEDRFGTIFAAFPDGHNTMYDFCLQLWTRGGELHNADGIPTLNTEPAIAGLEFYRRMVNDRSATPPRLADIDSVKSGELFASGSIAMMVNWFGFAAMCEQPGCPVKGKVAVAPLPTAGGAESATLLVYWILAVASGSRHPDEAFQFIRHCMSAEMDKVTTLSGGIGCRLSTWNDSEVNAAIPFYHLLSEMHQFVRCLPRSRQLPDLVHVVDDAVKQAITTDESTRSILDKAQQRAAEIRLL